MTMSHAEDRTTWSLDREIVLTRVIAVPRDIVFRAWTDAEQLVQWFGPAGFTIDSYECDVRVGGRWRFKMVAPDGTIYGNRMEFLQVEPPRLLVFDHGDDVDDDPGRFRVTITFDEQSDGKTVIMLRQWHPTKAQRDAAIGFGAVEYGNQTIDKLAAFVAKLAAKA
jgi:uncharacterized protein YndB with AHSA1/START domain